MLIVSIRHGYESLGGKNLEPPIAATGIASVLLWDVKPYQSILLYWKINELNLGACNA